MTDKMERTAEMEPWLNEDGTLVFTYWSYGIFSLRTDPWLTEEHIHALDAGDTHGFRFNDDFPTAGEGVYTRSYVFPTTCISCESTAVTNPLLFEDDVTVESQCCPGCWERIRWPEKWHPWQVRSVDRRQVSGFTWGSVAVEVEAPADEIHGFDDPEEPAVESNWRLVAEAGEVMLHVPDSWMRARRASVDSLWPVQWMGTDSRGLDEQEGDEGEDGTGPG